MDLVTWIFFILISPLVGWIGCGWFCFMGALCSAGAHYSKLIPVVDTEKWNLCGICEENCLTRVPITDYVKNNKGLVTNSECILCGKCIDDCKQDTIKIRFVWNRRSFALRAKAGNIDKSVVSIKYVYSLTFIFIILNFIIQDLHIFCISLWQWFSQNET